MGAHSDYVSDLTCTDVEKAMLVLNQGVIPARKIAFSWDDESLENKLFSMPWHVSYESPNAYLLLKGQIGRKAGAYGAKHPLVRPSDVRSFDSIHAGYWQGEQESYSGSSSPSWDEIADRVAASMAPILDGLVVDSPDDLELRTMRVSDIKAYYTALDLTPRIKTGLKEMIDVFANGRGLQLGQYLEKSYLLLSIKEEDITNKDKPAYLQEQFTRFASSAEELEKYLARA